MDITSQRALMCSRCIRKLPLRDGRRALSHAVRRFDSLSTTGTGDSPPTDFIAATGSQTSMPRFDRKTEARTRRRRMVLEQVGENSLKFEEMPFQCFQEARKFLLQDRKEKLQQIQTQRERMEKIKAQDVAPQDERRRELRLNSMRKKLEELKINADINDPLVKKKFEDGQGDMSKPIYRFLADRKWREYERKIVEQRITQMNVTPDVLPKIDLTVAARMTFRGRKLNHGEILPSHITEHLPVMEIQPFDRGTRLFTIAIINPDVPDVASDGFGSRCHFLAANIPVSPIMTTVDLAALDETTQVIQPWLPAYAQKGLPYQRMAVIIMEQAVKEDAGSDPQAVRSQELNVANLKSIEKATTREGYSLRGLVSRYRLSPVGADLYRTVWDEYTAGVMDRAGVIGADVEFRRKKIEPLPYKRMASRRYR